MSLNIGAERVIGAPQTIVSAIHHAAQVTGVDFDYLINQAAAESSLNPEAKAKTSSATGLYQFLDQTWLETVSKHGSEHGLSEEAKMIQQDFQGRYFVADDASRDAILTLRKDPKIAALMAAEFAADNAAILESRTGQAASATDLYFAHFLGAGGASKFLTARQNDPSQDAASLFPAAARSNKNIFYNSDGSMKSLEQVYNHFDAKFKGVGEGHVTPNDPQIASAKTYQRDIQFERMYGREVADFTRSLPSLNGLWDMGRGDFFAQVTGVQNNLFLTLMTLSDPI